ncbi:MAG TPA: Flp family type IVb pilin [Xanthobacteraceae bacterium]|jgi:pilus assembly protein Flp/PilA|nr:Flp family type IVb pilin [Xanthobacteraceae bacterium]
MKPTTFDRVRRLATTAARLVSDRAAATSIEYAMIAAGVSIVILTAVGSIGTAIRTNFYDRLIALM